MKGVARLIFLLLGLVLLGTGLYLIGLGFNVVRGYGSYLAALEGDLILAAVGGGLLLIGFACAVLGSQSPRSKTLDSVLQISEFGEIRIAIIAIENMVLRVVQQTQGIKDNGRRASYSPEGLIIHVKIKVMPDLELPALIGDLQSKIKGYLEEITGILVHEVKVTVENIILDQAPIKRTSRPL